MLVNHRNSHYISCQGSKHHPQPVPLGLLIFQVTQGWEFTRDETDLAKASSPDFVAFQRHRFCSQTVLVNGLPFSQFPSHRYASPDAHAAYYHTLRHQPQGAYGIAATGRHCCHDSCLRNRISYCGRFEFPLHDRQRDCFRQLGALHTDLRYYSSWNLATGPYA